MKALTILFLCFLAIFNLTGCNKQRTEPSVDRVTLEQLESLPSLPSKRLAFNVLTPQERYYVFKSKLENFIAQPEPSNIQKQLVKELLNALTLSLYEENKEAERKKFLMTFMAKWSEKAKIYFTISEYKNLIQYPFLKDNNSTSLNTEILTTLGTSNAPAPCDCTKNNHYDCDFETTESIFSCKAGCGESNFGCGDLWLQPCNGKCNEQKKPKDT